MSEKIVQLNEEVIKGRIKESVHGSAEETLSELLEKEAESLTQAARYPYVYVDGIYLRRNWGGEYENVAILVAIAVNEDGFREALASGSNPLWRAKEKRYLVLKPSIANFV